MSLASKKFGEEGEQIALRLLKEKGYEIVDRNYRFGKGEIDIIALDPVSKETVFVEVKSRQNLEYGDPVYAVDKKKIAQLKRMAQLYLFDKNIDEITCRFDVIAVLLTDGKPVIDHYVNAFD